MYRFTWLELDKKPVISELTLDYFGPFLIGEKISKCNVSDG